MIQFTQLRLSGFKSFVEPTELDVEPGLTGVVGPNGCGKSNIVESLRWVMGESSAKQMRGGEMDDVIFAGTRHRPARNVAEVSVTLDNSARTAPATLNSEDTLVVSRKINRGSGSTYRVNGKEVRARDVQLLFADASTGARSTAIVSQGKIGALIAANPAQRRALLEEAAGISGLHSRRHEAELRLRGAENNLTRLDDVLNALDVQKQGLDKQAKQATRYRTLSEDIRALDIALFHRNALDASTALTEARQALRDADATVAATIEAAAQASRQQFEAFNALEPAREAANTANSELQRLTLARESLEQEERRLDRATRGNAERLSQIAQDLEQAEHNAADASQRHAAITTEIATLETELSVAPKRIVVAKARLEECEAAREQAEAALSDATAQQAAAEAAHKAAERRRNDAQVAVGRAQARLQQADTDIQKAQTALVPADTLYNAETALAAALAHVESCQVARDTAETDRSTSESARAQANAEYSEADGNLRRLTAEIEALDSIIAAATPKNSDLPPILSHMTVEDGYEALIAAVLDHGADAPNDPDNTASRGWRDYPPLADLPTVPAGCEPLTRHVSAPSSLDRRLLLAYIAADSTTADRIAPTLLPGQCLVTKDGGLWRWDGYTRTPQETSGAASAAANLLQQTNRLKALQAERPTLVAAHQTAKDTLQAVQQAIAAAQAAEKTARDALRQAETTRTQAQQIHDRLSREQAQAQDRLSRLQDTRATLAQDLADADSTLANIAAELPDAPLPALAEAVTTARENTAHARTQANTARADHDTLVRDAATQEQRLHTLRNEINAWQDRESNADAHKQALIARRTTAQKEREELLARPEVLHERRNCLTHDLIIAEQARKDTTDTLAIAESTLRAADAQQKEADQAAAQAREDRVRAEAAVERREQAAQDIADRCMESLGSRVQNLDLTGAQKYLDLSTDEMSQRVQRRHQERERLGPVNLRADLEAEEVGKQIEALHTERDDLLAAIARLRQGIAELNREGRARLQKSFHTVNAVFQDTFKRLFGGGQAHLTLVEDDDPLAAGIEIMASPPGKKLQLLSLLSGGEQALTALALLFAVFQSNPAPICILDEVDAPLDDANVDRFCNLLMEMAETGATRFLVITHHRMTMARMDRLYGVTMVEQGISQMVSVDLKVAETLREDPISE